MYKRKVTRRKDWVKVKREMCVHIYVNRADILRVTLAI